MSRFLKAAVVGLVGLGLGAAALHSGSAPAIANNASSADTFQVDSVHSMVMFRIKHMGVAFNYGLFHNPTGTYNIDTDNPDESFIDISVKTEDVDTGNDKRDNHLRSPDFFNAKQYREISFKSTSFEKSGDGLVATGELTMSGVTKTIEVEIEKTGESDTPQGYKQGFEGRFSIQRSDFGMTKYIDGGGLGDEVTLMVTFEGARQ